MEAINERIKIFEALVNSAEVADYEGQLFTGVDLGTANIVLSVVDSQNNIVAGASYRSTVVKDGVVVDYIGAVKVVRDLKERLEERIGHPLIKAATAIPPGIVEGSVHTIVNVCEACDFEVVCVIDEPSAAAKVLGIDSGAVVDVGGGTTGISILEENKVTFSADEPTGGHHMTLVLSGSQGASYEEAEAIKLDISKDKENFIIIQPVVEKMASITSRFIKGKTVDKVYVVGGACSFSKFEQVFEKALGLPVLKPHNPMLVTPLGIAYACREEVVC